MNMHHLYNVKTKDWVIACDSCRVGKYMDRFPRNDPNVFPTLLLRSDTSSGFAQCDGCGLVMVFQVA